MPKVTPPLGFKGVVACLLRESPSLAPIEATPKVRQPAMLVEPMVTTPGYYLQSTIVIAGYLIGAARHSHGCAR